MKNPLQTTKITETALILKKSNKLLGITKKILEKGKQRKLLLKTQTTDIALKNKVWQDPDTGLIWQVEIEDNNDGSKYYGEFTWDEAFEYAKRLNAESYGGYSDWRVPSIEELTTIRTNESYENSKSWSGETYIKKPLLESMSMEWQGFWSAIESNSNSSQAWLVGFFFGYDDCTSKSNKKYVRCVRVGQ